MMSSEGSCSYTVRTVYRCDVCGFEVGHQREIVQHLKVHAENTESFSHNVCLDPAVMQKQDDVPSSTTVLPLKKSTRNSKRVLIQALDDQVLSERADSKPMVCTECGRTYKYKRCFERHIEQEHKTATRLTSFKTVNELHCKPATSSPPLSDDLNSADCELKHVESGNSSTDYLLNVSDEIELQEVTVTLDDVLTSVSDQTVEQVPNPMIAPYCCPDCPKCFHARNSLQIHITKKHLGWTFVCQWCGQLFVEGSELCSHAISEHSKSRDDSNTNSLERVFSSHSCLVCRLHYRSKETLEKHMASHGDYLSALVSSKRSGHFLRKSLLWQVHSDDHPYQKKLGQHVRIAHAPSLACHVPIVTSSSSLIQCDSTSTTPAVTDNVNLNGSQECAQRSCDKTGSTEWNISCHDQYCDTVTPIKDELPSYKNHTVPVPCPECGSAFFWRSNLRRHIRKQHQGNKASTCRRSSDVKQKNLQCNRCGRQFSRQSHLCKHLRAHENVEKSGGARSGSFLCSQCGQKMTTARLLHIHKLRHAGVRPHRCQLCEKSFFVVAELNSHVSVVHHGNRFICEQCGHEANSRSALRTHCRSVHPTLGVEPSFPCSACLRRFWTPAALRRHTMAHDLSRSSIRKAVCSVCSLAFRHVYNLSHHIKTTHTDTDCCTPFACATCHQQFDTGVAFKTHYRSKHRSR